MDRWKSWGRQLGHMLADNWGRAGERVRARRAAEAARMEAQDRVISGSKGGESAAATMPRPLAEVQARPASPRTARPNWREELSHRTEQAQANATAHAGPLDLAKRTFKEFGADNGTLMAASLAYYITLSLVPVVLVGISILGMIMGSNAAAQHEVMHFLSQFIPGTVAGANVSGGQRESIIQSAVQNVIASRGVVGGFGLIGLTLTALSGFETLETAMNIAWNTPKRGFLMSKLFALGMMLLVGALLLLSLGVTAITGLAEKLAVFSWLGVHDAVRGVIAAVVPLVIDTLMFTLIYKLFPNVKKSGWKPALIAGGITAVLWEGFKWAYTTFAPHFIHQDATYGTLAGFVGLIVWIYYSAALILLGSELAWVLEGCPNKQHDVAATAA